MIGYTGPAGSYHSPNLRRRPFEGLWAQRVCTEAGQNLSYSWTPVSHIGSSSNQALSLARAAVIVSTTTWETLEPGFCEYGDCVVEEIRGWRAASSRKAMPPCIILITHVTSQLSFLSTAWIFVEKRLSCTNGCLKSTGRKRNNENSK